MPARRKSRQRALQVLFLWDVRKLSIDEAVQNFYSSLYGAEVEEDTGEDPVDASSVADPFMENLARGTAAHFAEIDELILKRAANWRLERMPNVDRNILRLAIYEMKELKTPPPVVIDEALELARRYSEEDAVPFLNGVLDSVRKLILPDAPIAPNAAEPVAEAPAPEVPTPVAATPATPSAELPPQATRTPSAPIVPPLARRND
jgi:N utilization substance protein B